MQGEPHITTPKKESVASAVSQKSLAYYKEIAGRNLFKVASEKSKIPEPVNIENLAKTELSLKLWGTVTGDDKKSYAVIEDTKNRSQDLYRKGDSVQEAEIKMILRAKVVLNVNGKDEVLEMEQSEVSSVSRRTPVQPPRRSPLSTRKPGTQTISLQKSQVDDALKNVSDLMQQVKVMPHFENGQADGFSLTGIRPNSLVRRMGLRNGDIITGVNGKEIGSMEDVMKFYRDLGASDQISIQMKRRGRERTIEYNIKE